MSRITSHHLTAETFAAPSAYLVKKILICHPISSEVNFCLMIALFIEETRSSPAWKKGPLFSHSSIFRSLLVRYSGSSLKYTSRRQVVKEISFPETKSLKGNKVISFSESFHSHWCHWCLPSASQKLGKTHFIHDKRGCQESLRWCFLS